MNTTTFTHLLEHPESINKNQVKEIRNLINKFPYFQTAHALYLKGLKNKDSLNYNKALKITAAHTTDRNLLFDYITSPSFSQKKNNDPLKDIKNNHSITQVTDFKNITVNPIKKEESKTAPQLPEDVLKIGSPLDFNTSETHSFSEWLNLTTFKPIQREKNKVKNTNTTQYTDTSDTDSINWISRERKEEIINSFIETNPKIKVSPAKTKNESNPIESHKNTPDVLMTETLARVYLEQKSFKKARLAYRILSLKYPEKSGFFADQIRAIQELEENKK